jgi:hypothetical protein
MHTPNYLHGQLQVHTLNYRELCAMPGRAPLGSGLGGRRRIVTYDVGFATQVPRTLRARVSGHTPGW